MKQSEMDNKQEYLRLLDLLARVNYVNEGFSSSDVSDGERLWDANNLAHKFIGHALTILYLSHGTVVQDLPSFRKLNFPDSASIDVLTRATMEAFLVFHYVFYAPTTAEEKDCRYWVYKAAGLAERQNFPTITEEARQTLDNDKIELDELYTKLKSNKVFQALKDFQKRQIFEGKGKWRWKLGCKSHISWREIAIDAGFSEMLASPIYKYLSGYAHSSSLSVLQTAQALVNKETEKLIKPLINTMNILIANMISEYSGLFPRAKDVLRESGEIDFVKKWINGGRRLGDNLDTNTGKMND
ncbi:DUF5677 domain-containing protein [Chloroflexota bacterium]